MTLIVLHKQHGQVLFFPDTMLNDVFQEDKCKN